MVHDERMKIWYQSFVDAEHHGPYFSRLRDALAGLSDPDVAYHLAGISPPDQELNRLTEFRCAAQVVRNAIAAQQEGYDAFAIGHFQDGGLYEARAAVDIPVLSLGESSMLFACTLGHKVGIVTIHPLFIPMIEEQVVRYGLKERIVAVQAITSNPADLARTNDDAAAFDRFLDQFREQVQPLLDRGVEVIIAGGGLPAMLLSRLKGFTVGAVPVVNPIGVLAKMTEMAVKLYRLNGTRVSRAGTFAKASDEALREFLAGAKSAKSKTRGKGSKR